MVKSISCDCALSADVEKLHVYTVCATNLAVIIPFLQCCLISLANILSHDSCFTGILELTSLQLALLVVYWCGILYEK